MVSDFGSRYRLIPLFGMLLVALVVNGCGGGGPPKAEAKGKVTANGQPVKGGTIVLAPVVAGSGEQATGEIQSDGTFVLKSSTSDGAPIGKNMVSFKPPKTEYQGTPDDWDSSKGEPPRPKSEYEGFVPKEKEVEIKTGSNEINVELIPGS